MSAGGPSWVPACAGKTGGWPDVTARVRWCRGTALPCPYVCRSGFSLFRGLCEDRSRRFRSGSPRAAPHRRRALGRGSPRPRPASPRGTSTHASCSARSRRLLVFRQAPATASGSSNYPPRSKMWLSRSASYPSRGVSNLSLSAAVWARRRSPCRYQEAAVSKSRFSRRGFEAGGTVRAESASSSRGPRRPPSVVRRQ